MERPEDNRLKNSPNKFDQYVMNDIPIRLVRLSDMTLVGRNDVKNHFRSSVTEDLEDPAKLVKYAILSHRWLDSKEEPTYEEMKSGRASGPGYGKLKKFCEKARAYNFEFAWSDTCCMDKSNGTELDESIRSMFRWYENSAICIIHLAQSETIVDIMGNEWTERGWTLQELLAPHQIKFFNKHWMPMTGDVSDKSWKDTEVMKILERATGIPLHDLREYHPGPVRVDERMSWAARRKTSRVEDVAYSLMGIFDVSLQIAYGEGGDRAFCRLFEAIMQSGDRSVLNWTGEAAKHHCSHAIPRSPQNFVGRTLELPVDPSLGPLEMTMTSLGLRVPLVILPLSVCSTRQVAGRYDVTVERPLCPAIKFNFVAASLAGHDTNQFALGIVDYSLGSSDLPQTRGRSAGCILHRSALLRDICRPSSRDFISIKIVFPPKHDFGQWKNVDGTGLVELNFPNVRGKSTFYISREYLEIVYL
ncbi:hypothetical protein K503DRAFT_84491 [Rhizopogon vinicolor AM-OR11-026]|uniref:Heterokaryon incompatibility domain-containing protein n=1 Tax=Rhizopogon vinicolor AM-OR11-026 TaxID=1314800 RepID=A0A1B7N3N2_9AGAM|nr:hypothetical protein K503DRAFT_84491 [Rhizopogon vinicolor AM-OR11-026]